MKREKELNTFLLGTVGLVPEKVLVLDSTLVGTGFVETDSDGTLPVMLDNGSLAGLLVDDTLVPALHVVVAHAKTDSDSLPLLARHDCACDDSAGMSLGRR